MSLSENFQKVIDPMNRTIAAGALALVTLFTATGCASLDRVSKVEAGGIPVGSVFTKSLTRGTVDARRAVGNAAVAPIRPTACTIQQEQPRTQGPGLLGTLGAVADRLFSVNTTVSIGDPTCGQQSQVDPNGVGPRPTR